eukprot:TRINITY_DN38232_c0_g2_i1.p1 TRINITY_DN38232_c0_g2~~TRINITY_DN38232_c0_g2_i1.p1  ORF type:complete len:1765 (+),score=264.42 TRINITY_DN38232_c0_g2_i1:49-5343(+)
MESSCRGNVPAVWPRRRAPSAGAVVGSSCLQGLGIPMPCTAGQPQQQQRALTFGSTPRVCPLQSAPSPAPSPLWAPGPLVWNLLQQQVQQQALVQPAFSPRRTQQLWPKETAAAVPLRRSCVSTPRTARGGSSPIRRQQLTAGFSPTRLVSSPSAPVFTYAQATAPGVVVVPVAHANTRCPSSPAAIESHAVPSRQQSAREVRPMRSPRHTSPQVHLRAASSSLPQGPSLLNGLVQLSPRTAALTPVLASSSSAAVLAAELVTHATAPAKSLPGSMTMPGPKLTAAKVAAPKPRPRVQRLLSAPVGHDSRGNSAGGQLCPAGSEATAPSADSSSGGAICRGSSCGAVTGSTMSGSAISVSGVSGAGASAGGSCSSSAAWSRKPSVVSSSSWQPPQQNSQQSLQSDAPLPRPWMWAPQPVCNPQPTPRVVPQPRDSRQSSSSTHVATAVTTSWATYGDSGTISDCGRAVPRPLVSADVTPVSAHSSDMGASNGTVSSSAAPSPSPLRQSQSSATPTPRPARLGTTPTALVAPSLSPTRLAAASSPSRVRLQSSQAALAAAPPTSWAPTSTVVAAVPVATTSQPAFRVRQVSSGSTALGTAAPLGASLSDADAGLPRARRLSNRSGRSPLSSRCRVLSPSTSGALWTATGLCSTQSPLSPNSSSTPGENTSIVLVPRCSYASAATGGHSSPLGASGSGAVAITSSCAEHGSYPSACEAFEDASESSFDLSLGVYGVSEQHCGSSGCTGQGHLSFAADEASPQDRHEGEFTRPMGVSSSNSMPTANFCGENGSNHSASYALQFSSTNNVNLSTGRRAVRSQSCGNPGYVVQKHPSHGVVGASPPASAPLGHHATCAYVSGTEVFADVYQKTAVPSARPPFRRVTTVDGVWSGNAGDAIANTGSRFDVETESPSTVLSEDSPSLVSTPCLGAVPPPPAPAPPPPRPKPRSESTDCRGSGLCSGTSAQSDLRGGDQRMHRLKKRLGRQDALADSLVASFSRLRSDGCGTPGASVAQASLQQHVSPLSVESPFLESPATGQTPSSVEWTPAAAQSQPGPLPVTLARSTARSWRNQAVPLHLYLYAWLAQARVSRQEACISAAMSAAAVTRTRRFATAPPPRPRRTLFCDGDDYQEEESPLRPRARMEDLAAAVVGAGAATLAEAASRNACALRSASADAVRTGVSEDEALVGERVRPTRSRSLFARSLQDREEAQELIAVLDSAFSASPASPPSGGVVSTPRRRRGRQPRSSSLPGASFDVPVGTSAASPGWLGAKASWAPGSSESSPVCSLEVNGDSCEGGDDRLTKCGGGGGAARSLIAGHKVDSVVVVSSASEACTTPQAAKKTTQVLAGSGSNSGSCEMGASSTCSSSMSGSSRKGGGSGAPPRGASRSGGARSARGALPRRIEWRIAPGWQASSGTLNSSRGDSVSPPTPPTPSMPRNHGRDPLGGDCYSGGQSMDEGGVAISGGNSVGCSLQFSPCTPSGLSAGGDLCGRSGNSLNASVDRRGHSPFLGAASEGERSRRRSRSPCAGWQSVDLSSLPSPLQPCNGGGASSVFSSGSYCGVFVGGGGGGGGGSVFSSSSGRASGAFAGGGAGGLGCPPLAAMASFDDMYGSGWGDSGGDEAIFPQPTPRVSAAVDGSTEMPPLLGTLRRRAAVLSQRLLQRERQCSALREALDSCTAASVAESASLGGVGAEDGTTGQEARSSRGAKITLLRSASGGECGTTNGVREYYGAAGNLRDGSVLDTARCGDVCADRLRQPLASRENIC